MSGTQRQNASVGHRFGYGLGQMVKRVRAAWFRMEIRLVQSAGKHAPLVTAGLLILKVLLGIAGLLAVLFAAFWLAAFVLAVFALITFGSVHHEESSSLFEEDGYRNGHAGFGYYMGGMRVDDE
ncbi:MAG: DUF3742 family protein [Ectopseudomonas guguanensis]|uniref:DUF3742 family protein n=1 Tax=Ectopseudomonas guguanensis TaxID=1198456 RepID=UPI00391BAE0F